MTSFSKCDELGSEGDVYIKATFALGNRHNQCPSSNTLFTS